MKILIMSCGIDSIVYNFILFDYLLTDSALHVDNIWYSISKGSHRSCCSPLSMSTNSFLLKKSAVFTINTACLSEILLIFQLLVDLNINIWMLRSFVIIQRNCDIYYLILSVFRWINEWFIYKFINQRYFQMTSTPPTS